MIKMISKAALIIAALSTSQMALAESVKFETTLGNFTVELNSEKALFLWQTSFVMLKMAVMWALNFTV